MTPEQIRAFRAEHEIARNQLAGALGASTTTVQNWETGNFVAVPRLQRLLAELIKLGPMAFGPPRAAGVYGGTTYDSSAVVGHQLTAAATIVAGYLQVQQRRLSSEEIVKLIQAVRGALT